MGSLIREVLGVTPSIKIVSQMNENLKSDGFLSHSEKKVSNSLDGNMVSIPIATSIGVSIKQKPISKWKLTGFKNSARTDSLLLYHWTRIQHLNKQNSKTAIKKDKELDSEDSSNLKQNNDSSNSLLEDNLKKDHVHSGYYFSKFNRHLTVYSFQSDQYNKYLKDIDPDWSEEDTSFLFDLCKEFDLRFVVIHDRYIPPSGKQRSLEQLKHRYYSISKKLVEISFDAKRRSLGNSPDPSMLASLKEERNRHPYIRYTYNIDFDKNRRIALLENYNEKNIRRDAKKIIQDIQVKSVLNNGKRGLGNSSKLVGDLIEIENEINQEQQLIGKLKNYDSFGPRKSGATTAGALCYHYVSSLPRKFPSDVENFLKHFKLDIFPLPYFNMQVAEQYCIMRCDLLILLSTRKKLQRLNSLKHAWQEKLRTAILQNDELINNQADHEEKVKNQTLTNPANRKIHLSSVSPNLNISRSNQRHRGKTVRTTQEQTMQNPGIHSELGMSQGTSQMQPNNNETSRRDIDSNEKPRKRSKSSVSRYITQQSGFINQSINNTNSFQLINNQTIISPNSGASDQYILQKEQNLGR